MWGWGVIQKKKEEEATSEELPTHCWKVGSPTGDEVNCHI